MSIILSVKAVMDDNDKVAYRVLVSGEYNGKKINFLHGHPKKNNEITAREKTTLKNYVKRKLKIGGEMNAILWKDESRSTTTEEDRKRRKDRRTKQRIVYKKMLGLSNNSQTKNDDGEWIWVNNRKPATTDYVEMEPGISLMSEMNAKGRKQHMEDFLKWMKANLHLNWWEMGPMTITKIKSEKKRKTK